MYSMHTVLWARQDGSVAAPSDSPTPQELNKPVKLQPELSNLGKTLGFSIRKQNPCTVQTAARQEKTVRLQSRSAALGGAHLQQPLSSDKHPSSQVLLGAQPEEIRGLKSTHIGSPPPGDP